MLLGALLVLAATMAALLSWHYEQRDVQEKSRLEAKAGNISERIGRQLQTIHAALSQIQKELPGGPKDTVVATINARLSAYADVVPGIRSIELLNAQGVVTASNLAELSGQNFRDRDYFQTPARNPARETFYVGSPTKDKGGTWSINVTKANFNDRGQFAGVISASVDLEEFRAALESVLYEDDVLAYLTHGDGKLFLTARPRVDILGKNLAEPGTHFSRHMASQQTANIYTGTIYATGKPGILAVHTIQPPELKMDKPLVAAITRDLDALAAPWRDQVILLASVFSLIALITTAGLYQMHQRRRSSEERVVEAQVALAQSERFMRLVIDVVPGMVGYWNKDLRCEFANRAYLEWFGRSAEEMKGIHIRHLLGPELFAKNEGFISATLKGERQSFERTLVKSDGSTGYTLAHYVPDPDHEAGVPKGFFVLILDITPVKKAELALRESQRFLSDLIEHSATVIYAKDKDGKYLLVNRKYEETTGLTRGIVLGRTDGDLYTETVARQFRENDLEVINNAKIVESEEILVGAGETQYFLSLKFPLREESGKINGLCGISTDITERKKSQLEIERLSRLDVLTDLPNRRYFIERAEQELSRAHRYESQLSVMMIDVDHFKRINDGYGHKAGDKVLSTLGVLLKNTFRETDIVGRIGGEEFAVLLPETSKEQAEEVGERLRTEIENYPIRIDDASDLKMTVSIGITSLSSNDANLEFLLGQADKGLYQAKQAGRNRLFVIA